jgi:hypothetical protein
VLKSAADTFDTFILVDVRATFRASICPRVIVDKFERLIFVTFRELDRAATLEFVVERPMLRLERPLDSVDKFPFVIFRELESVVTFAFVVTSAADRFVIAV